MKKGIVFLISSMFAISVFIASAADAQLSNYAVAKAGAYFPNGDDLKGFSTGFNGEVAIGHYFNKNFAGELGFGYFQSSGSASASSGGISAAASGDIYAIPVTLAVKAIYPIDKWEIYALGGMGAYFCNAKVNVSGTSGGFSFSGSQSSSATSFGGFLGAGADVNITENWFIGVEGKYLWTKPSFSFAGQSIDAKFDGWTVTGNVGFRF